METSRNPLELPRSTLNLRRDAQTFTRFTGGITRDLDLLRVYVDDL